MGGGGGKWGMDVITANSDLVFFFFFLWIDLTKGKVLKCAFAYDLSLAVLR